MALICISEIRMHGSSNKEREVIDMIEPTEISSVHKKAGKIGYVVALLLGVPLPVLFIVYILRGCE